MYRQCPILAIIQPDHRLGRLSLRFFQHFSVSDFADGHASLRLRRSTSFLPLTESHFTPPIRTNREKQFPWQNPTWDLTRCGLCVPSNARPPVAGLMDALRAANDLIHPPAPTEPRIPLPPWP
jgi:hypothetical protein